MPNRNRTPALDPSLLCFDFDCCSENSSAPGLDSALGPQINMTYNGKPFMQKQGPAACPAGAKCCTCLFCEAGGCIYPNSTECWSPGPGQDISTDLPNCLIIGDSVSNQYTPVVTALLNSTCKVQHAPWVGGGSANNADNGLRNLQGEKCRMGIATQHIIHLWLSTVPTQGRKVCCTGCSMLTYVWPR